MTPQPASSAVTIAGEGLTPRVDPFLSYLDGLLADLTPEGAGRAGSSAICLGAFARLGKLGPEAPRVVRALAAALGRGELALVETWLCSAALRKTVYFEAAECAGCAGTLRALMQHRDEQVVRDVTLALASGQSAGC